MPSSSHLLADPSTALVWPVPSYLTGPISPSDPEYDPSPLQHPASLPHLTAMAISMPFQSNYHPVSFADHMLPFQPSFNVETYPYSPTDLDMQRLLMNDGLLHDSGTAVMARHNTHGADELLSPVSVQSFLSATNTQFSPSQSPTDMRSPHDFPGVGTTHIHTSDSSPTRHGSSLPMMSPALPEEHTLTFDSSVHAYQKRPKLPTQTETDPFAAGFLREQLGQEKWGLFSARLYERRLGGPKARSRGRKLSGDGELQRNTGASALDFLIKVEVVKEVLRVYVPHPYNPFKSLTHPYEGAPSGLVTLTRSTVLALSGWSNTQFSYWARRAEAICVLAPYDQLLNDVAIALTRRLNPPSQPGRPSPSSSANVSPLTSPVSSTTSFSEPECAEPAVTGKGLDQLIDEVKRRTGQSPFLRGKHASLDPFGSPGGERESASAVHPVYQPTFQAQMYSHSAHTSVKKRRRRDSGDSQESWREGGLSVPIKSEGDDESSLYVEVSGDVADGGERRVFFKVSDSRAATPPSTPPSTIAIAGSRRRGEREDGRLYAPAPERAEAFPVSDSRLERERGARKRARTGAA